MSPEALRDMLMKSTVSPYSETLAFELLYAEEGASLKKITEKTSLVNKLPSQAVEEHYGMLMPDYFTDIEQLIDSKLGRLSVAINNTPTWPEKLADSARPTPLFYYYGEIGLLESKSISIVGSRKSSQQGLARAAKMARELAARNITIVSGLAKGIDTAAMTSVLNSGGRVIGVIGTPIDECYPSENRELQGMVAKNHLLVSQVPFYRYSKQPFKTRRFYFPERNELMAAISDATIIIEASDTSGTLTQARACMHQGRKLFILKSCYENKNVTWPSKWAERENVYVVDSSESVVSILYG